MNIFNKDALQRLKRSRARTAVTIVGVALSAAMITAVSTFAVSLQDYMVQGAVQKYGSWQVSFPDVDAAFAQEQAENSQVEDLAVCENVGYALLDGGINAYKPYVFVTGFSKDDFGSLPVNLVSGRMPENSEEVLVPAHVALNGGVKFSVGDRITLSIGMRRNGEERLNQHDPYISGEEPGTEREVFVPEEEKTYTVVGICQRPAFEERTAPGYTLITMTDSAETADSLSVFVTLKKPYQVHVYAKTSGKQTYVLNDDVLRFMGLSEDQMFNMLLYSVGAILLLLIMTGSIFLIYNSFNISLNERMHQFGILLSVGATEKQLRKSVLFEGLCIGLVGIPLGILIGIPSIQFVLYLVSENFRNILYDTVPLALRISLPAILVSAVISMFTILVSAYIPARKAARVPVMECIRQTNEIKVEARVVKTSRLISRMWGLPGVLAMKNFKRNKRRYRSIVMSLTLSVVLFISANTFKMHLDRISQQSVVEADGDLLFCTRDMEEKELFQLYEELKANGKVTDSTYQAVLTYSCKVPVNRLTPEFLDECRENQLLTEGQDAELLLDIQFIEDGVYEKFLESQGLPLEDYAGTDARIIAVGKRSGNTDLFAENSIDITIRAGESGPGKTLQADFVEIFPLDPPPAKLDEIRDYVFMGIVPYTQKPLFDGMGAPVSRCLTFWSENPGQSERQMKIVIEGAGVASEYELYNIHKVLEENRNTGFIINLFTIVFVAMISLIATANVFNTISTNIKLRRRELAMLRSVGMSDQDFNRMMRFECILYGMRTLLFGLPLAGLVSWLIYMGLAATGEEVSFVFSWGSTGISILGVFCIIFVTMVYAVGRVRRENIIDALKDDMM